MCGLEENLVAMRGLRGGGYKCVGLGIWMVYTVWEKIGWQVVVSEIASASFVLFIGLFTIVGEERRGGDRGRRGLSMAKRSIRLKVGMRKSDRTWCSEYEKSVLFVFCLENG